MILKMPDGYNTQIGDGGSSLSGGQRQRIALARALYGNPKLVVLDEPDASLDSGAENRLIQTLQGLKGKSTVVLITHRLSLLNLADKVLMLRGGLVEAFGLAPGSRGAPHRRRRQCATAGRGGACGTDDEADWAGSRAGWPQGMTEAVQRGGAIGRITPKKVRAAPIGPLPGAANSRPKGAVMPVSFRGPILAGCAIILIFFVGLGGWAAVAPLSSASAATGTVIVDSKRKVIQHLEGGIVREILVHDNDTVKAGQVLLRLDDTQAKARLQLITGRYYGALALAARLQAEELNRPDIDFPPELMANKTIRRSPSGSRPNERSSRRGQMSLPARRSSSISAMRSSTRR